MKHSIENKLPKVRILKHERCRLDVVKALLTLPRCQDRKDHVWYRDILLALPAYTQKQINEVLRRLDAECITFCIIGTGMGYREIQSVQINAGLIQTFNEFKRGAA